MERLRGNTLGYFSSGLSDKDKRIIIEKIEYELLFNDFVVLTITKKRRGGA